MGAILSSLLTGRTGRRPTGYESRRRKRLAALGFGLGLLMLAGGCDSLSFTPARPTELTPSGAPGGVVPAATATPASPARAAAKASKTRARLVELILSQPPDVDRLYLEQFLRRDSGVQKFAFRSTKPEKPDAPMSP